MYYLIYKITNTANNKIYIGKHKTDDIDDGYMGSGKYLKHSQNKHGIDKFKKEILYQFNSEDEANSMEEELVNEEFIARLDTYNIKLGGNGGFDHINGILGLNRKNHDTEEYYEKLKIASIKGSRILKEMRRENTEFNEYMNQKSLNNLRIFHERYPHGAFFKKHHTEETKRKIGLANSKYQMGKKNSQYGTC